MRKSAEKSIEKLSLYYYRSGREVRTTSNRGLCVMAYSLEKRGNATLRELRQLYNDLGGDYDIGKVDRKRMHKYISSVYERLSKGEKPLLSPRMTRLGYALWSRGYAIYSLTRFLRSVNRFAYCVRLSDLGLYEIEETIRKIRKEPLSHERYGTCGWWEDGCPYE